MKRILPLLLCLFAWPVMAGAPKPLLLTHVGLIDGTGSPVQRDMTIVIKDKRIAAVYPGGSQPAPENARTLIDALKNLSIIGALFMIAGYGRGPRPTEAAYSDV